MANLPKYRDRERHHLSVSRILAYLGCGWQYYLRYIEKKRGPNRARQSYGKAAHSTVAKDLHKKKDEGFDFGRDEIRDIWRTELAVEMASVELDRKEKEEFGTKLRAHDELKQQGDKALMAFLNRKVRISGDDDAAEDEKPKTKEEPATDDPLLPSAVEQRVEIPTTGDFDLIVIPDLLQARGPREFKFSQRVEDADSSLQLTFEAMAFATLTGGALPQEVGIETYRRYKREQKPPRLARSKRSLEDVETGMKITNIVAEGITNDVFLPTGLNTWRCDYCEFGIIIGDGSCVFVRRGAR